MVPNIEVKFFLAFWSSWSIYNCANLTLVVFRPQKKTLVVFLFETEPAWEVTVVLTKRAKTQRVQERFNCTGMGFFVVLPAQQTKRFFVVSPLAERGDKDRTRSRSTGRLWPPWPELLWTCGPQVVVHGKLPENEQYYACKEWPQAAQDFRHSLRGFRSRSCCSVDCQWSAMAWCYTDRHLNSNHFPFSLLLRLF